MMSRLRGALLTTALICGLLQGTVADCPYITNGNLPASTSTAGFNKAAFDKVDFQAVKADLKAALTNSRPFWPADFGSYAGLWVRMAWHCAGTYRQSDGRGGCDGARQRFDPERSWPDNTNLDKARALLQPIKLKHGPGLSWGDLIILAGNVAIEASGGPILGFCAGRVDDADGAASLPLGPSPEQDVVAPCADNGNCSAPLGATTMGLIYVNPEGPMGKPIPKSSVPQIRDTFARMGMNDSETVALIGGGHAFGKTHGACPTGPGPAPKDDPYNPWPGTCGTGPMKGKANNTFTAGFEGPWTTVPTQWDNEYFNNLLGFDWLLHMGPGGHYQWRPLVKGTNTTADVDIMMLTTDVALTREPTYRALVVQYAQDIKALEDAFKHAWYKLTTRDMGPHTRCLGADVPPPQPFQNPLPPPPKKLPNFDQVKADIKKVMYTTSSILDPDVIDGKPTYGPVFATLAYQCASTFRATDYRGGCNGARIRFAPEANYSMNAYSDHALALLEPIKAKYGDSLTYADLIVLAGNTALEEAGSPKLKFCGGRSDAKDGAGSANLDERRYSDPIVAVTDTQQVMGLTPREFVALCAKPRSPAQQKRLGYSGSWTSDPSRLSTRYFKMLMGGGRWINSTAPNGEAEFRVYGTDWYMTEADMGVKYSAVFAAVVQEYAVDYKTFLKDFAGAWTKLMNADRFEGPAGNVCE